MGARQGTRAGLTVMPITRRTSAELTDFNIVFQATRGDTGDGRRFNAAVGATNVSREAGYKQ
jgi:hypothetical protein